MAERLAARPTTMDVTLGDRVYAQILERVVSGDLAPSERLPNEAQLAASFGVSRPLVREALARHIDTARRRMLDG